MQDTNKMALLIDAENVSDKYINHIFKELSTYPETKVTIKRIYGNWTTPKMQAWKTVLLDFSITPIQQYSYTSGKNSTDSALIIDAMDILYSESVSAFCIVSSDSDFTRLASRLRESGMFVIGMGEKKTPKPFITACESFKYLEVISNEEALSKNSPEFNSLIDNIVKYSDQNCDDDGFVFLGKVGTYLKNINPDFDVRNFGHKTLTNLIRSTNRFYIESRGDKASPTLTYIKNK